MVLLLSRIPPVLQLISFNATRMTKPLCSIAITAISKLLRACPPLYNASILSASQGFCLCFSLIITAKLHKGWGKLCVRPGSEKWLDISDEIKYSAFENWGLNISIPQRTLSWNHPLHTYQFLYFLGLDHRFGHFTEGERFFAPTGGQNEMICFHWPKRWSRPLS